MPISLVSSGGTSDWVANSDNTISNNDMFNFTGWGVGVGSGSKSWSITGNTIYQTAARTTQLEGISFSGLGSNTIRGNIVRDMTTSVDAFGIDIPGQAGNTIIAGNRIWNLGNRSGAISRIRGINFAPSASQSVTVANNMIVLSSSGATNQNLSGIHNLGAAGSTTVTAFNSVLITGTGSGGRDT